MRTASSVLAAACVALAPIPGIAAAPSPARTGTSASGGKPAAPVDVAAVVRADGAQVEVTFRTAATSVDVRVSGTAGLEVTSPAAAVSAGSFARGGSAKLAVSFLPPAGRAHLVVTVSGTFNGVRSARVASFTVGQPTASQLREAGEGRRVDASGRNLKELPAERR